MHQETNLCLCLCLCLYLCLCLCVYVPAFASASASASASCDVNVIHFFPTTHTRPHLHPPTRYARKQRKPATRPMDFKSRKQKVGTYGVCRAHTHTWLCLYGLCALTHTFAPCDAGGSCCSRRHPDPDSCGGCQCQHHAGHHCRGRCGGGGQFQSSTSNSRHIHRTRF